MPNGVGFSSLYSAAFPPANSNKLVKCSVADCLQCQPLNTDCKGCGLTKYLDISRKVDLTSNRCIYASNKDIASNIVPGTLTIDKCTDTFCLDCSTSIDICLKCDKNATKPYLDLQIFKCTDV